MDEGVKDGLSGQLPSGRSKRFPKHARKESFPDELRKRSNKASWPVLQCAARRDWDCLSECLQWIESASSVRFISKTFWKPPQSNPEIARKRRMLDIDDTHAAHPRVQVAKFFSYPRAFSMTSLLVDP
jgi:hypothetical protein